MMVAERVRDHICREKRATGLPGVCSVTCFSWVTEVSAGGREEVQGEGEAASGPDGSR